MSALERALLTIAGELHTKGIPYMVIGGIANLIWGVPRTTMDVDVTVWVEDEQIPNLIEHLMEEFRLLVQEPVAFVQETRVLPIETPEGIRVDITFGQLPYEEQAIRRARPVEFGGAPVLICAPEDLIIHKIISERPQDREDVRGIIRHIGSQLDRAYIEPILRGLAEDLVRPDLLVFYEECFGDEV